MPSPFIANLRTSKLGIPLRACDNACIDDASRESRDSQGLPSKNTVKGKNDPLLSCAIVGKFETTRFLLDVRGVPDVFTQNGDIDIR